MKYDFSDEVVKPTRYDGKPLSFKFKYLMANRPGFFAAMVMGVIAPIITAVRLYRYPDCPELITRRFKDFYMVIRDDDPRVPKLIEEKEYMRHKFPKTFPEEQ